MRSSMIGLVGLMLVACGGATARSAPPQPAAAATASVPARASALPAPVASGLRELPELAQAFAAERVTGTIALFDSQEGVLACSDLKRCQTRVTPASTFKIPHSLVALETGLVDGPDTVLPWDKQTYSNDNWNQDLSFRDAFRFSCVPCYRAIARKLGDRLEQEWLNKLGYGNRSIAGGTDKFWLEGGLTISPLEQIDFLRRFDGDQLPISPQNALIVRDIMTLDVTESYVLRGKTGSTGTPEDAHMLAWLVGWVEQGERRVFFATLIDSHAPGVDPTQLPRPLTERILRSKGWL
jgi:beta-lactamase class D